MKIYHSLLVLVSLILSSQLIAKEIVSSNGSNKVIYGEDNRRDVFESTNASFIELSKSTAAMINKNNLKAMDSGEIEINASTMEGRGYCSKERFSKQITAANCSGFLVGDKHLVTAGHCVTNDYSCKTYNWVFDYKVESAEQGAINVSKNSVYSCAKIVSRSLNSYTKDDWALIELDRPVTDRSPLTFRRSGKVQKGDDLVVIGHPTGLPTKIADGAAVRSLQDKYFVANLDTFGGNSGSAVFNVRTQEVEGILVRGERDFVYNSELGCQESNVCTNEGCSGEDVTYITNIPELSNL